MPDPALYPRIKSSVRVNNSGNGAHVRSGDTGFLLNRVPRRVVDGLFAMMNGRMALADIKRRVPEKLEPLVDRVIDALIAHDLIYMSPFSLRDWEAEGLSAYRNSLLYIADQAEDANAAVDAWRQKPILVGGKGVPFMRLVLGLVQSGAGKLLILHEPGRNDDILRRRISAHAQADSAFEARWISGEETGEYAQSARLAYASDDGLFPAGGEAGTTCQNFDVFGVKAGLLGGARGDGTLFVGPDLKGGRDLWSRIEQSEPVPTKASASHYSLSVLGSLVAFQTMRAVLADMSEGSTSPFADTLFQISPLGDVTRHVLRTGAPVKPSGPMPPSATASQQAAADRQRWETALSPLFEPVTGCLSWRNFEPVPVVPLVHRCIELCPKDGRPNEVVTEWSLTPQMANSRTARRALELLADRTTGSPGHAAELDIEAWHARAFAAWAERAGLCKNYQALELELESIGNASIRLLVRLARLYTDALPTIFLTTHADSPIAKAECMVGLVHCCAVRTTVEAAIEDSLGDAISLAQRGLQTAEMPKARDRHERATLDSFAIPRAADADAFGLVAKYLNQFALAEVQGVIVGRYEAKAG
jgi:hypothetical protein